MTEVYARLAFPATYSDRPYTAIDMVATIDGKILSGGRDETVADLGSSVDHLLMKRIEAAADGVLIGANTLRATSTAWNPRTKKRFVVSNSGNLPEDAAFFREEAYVATSSLDSSDIPPGAKLLLVEGGRLDFHRLFQQVRELGVERLLILGGSELNGQLLHEDLVDELFLTVAPKVKLGKDVPTYAGGEPLGRDHLLNFDLIEHHAVGNEVFLRYRRERKK